MSNALPGSTLTVGRVTSSIAVLLVLSLVVPPLLSTKIAAGRVERARTGAAEVAARIRTDTSGAQRLAAAGVLAGAGRLPKAAGSSGAWLHAARGALAASPDPWGNAYLVMVGEAASDVRIGLSVFVLSAGPNGVIETPWPASGATVVPRGDDISVRVP